MARDRWVLFDLDGTLFDYDAAERAAVTATLEAAGLPTSAEVFASYRQINARHWLALERGETTPARLRVERWSEVLTEHGIDPRDADSLAQDYLGNLAQGTQLMDGAHEVVADVARTHRVGYLTNGLADVQRPRLDASPLSNYGEALVISDEVGAAKPHPAIFEAVFAQMGEPDRATITMVGDNLVADIGGAAALGLQTVWFTPNEGTIAPEGVSVTPTHRISSLHELPALLATSTAPS